jgi:hypothetical protein
MIIQRLPVAFEITPHRKEACDLSRKAVASPSNALRNIELPKGLYASVRSSVTCQPSPRLAHRRHHRQAGRIAGIRST